MVNEPAKLLPLRFINTADKNPSFDGNFFSDQTPEWKMGQKCGETLFYRPIVSETGGLYFNTINKHWTLAHDFGSYKLTKITLKQLIELLVSEQKPAEKIAVRVDNEKEFNALMKYYDSLGWKTFSDLKVNSIINIWSKSKYPQKLTFNDGFEMFYKQNTDGYKIIPFSEFEKEYGIRAPRLTTFDGVDVFDGDTIAVVNLKDHNKGNRNFLINERDTFDDWLGITHYAFSTEQAALDWIEAQKPKEVIVSIWGDEDATVYKDKVVFTDPTPYLKLQDIEAIHKAMEELNS